MKRIASWVLLLMAAATISVGCAPGDSTSSAPQDEIEQYAAENPAPPATPVDVE
ncbi:hypothetical protein LOC71_19830 [Rhodopirellula sp. JC740]|uniref:Secreted protein n=1 Tax=Rhodopirellula halodulae TaxID=2894198 RepID=A0ABS8NMC6_9BACT|nr:hypothetical protein [Rhodopirellula sp. JC740]MCC9644529.1 hypothetical protein [Rhodopirellula sp. JC740]